MKSKDFISQKTRELSQKILTAVQSGDENAISQAFSDFQSAIAQQNSEEISQAIQQMDSAILATRGVKQLTTEEKDFFQKLIDASSSADPKQAISDLTKAMPETVIDTVLEDIQDNHALLDLIDFQNTAGQIKMIYNAGDIDLATWDTINTGITKELAGAINSLDMTFCKLTAFLPVPMDMIDLGPSWLLTLVVTILSEALAKGLEDAIINGDGNKKPVGMTRDLTTVTNGVYGKKTPVILDEITPVKYNAVVATLAAKPNGGYRTIPEVILVVNPVDYLTKVLPATTVLTTEGTYKTEVFPYPTRVIQSAELDEGEAVIGIAKRYFMGIGTSKTGKIEYDDSVQFLADNRVYKIKLHGNGRPKDNNAFKLLDISNIQPINRQVEIVNTTNNPVNTKEVAG